MKVSTRPGTDVRPTVIDLFSGPGGMSLGFRRAGFRIAAAVDFDKSAVATHRANLGNHVIQADLTREAPFTAASDVVVGGPPCQGFSSAGLRRPGDHRNTLIARFSEIVAAQRPTAFVFENVEGFLTYDHGAYVLDLLAPLIDAGYRIHLRKINAANYGLPQHRKRVIAIGGLGWDPSFPEPTHSAFGAPGAHQLGRGLTPAPDVMSAISSLPTPGTDPPGNPDDHWYRPLEGVDRERLESLQPGQRMRDLPEDLHHPSYRRRAFRRVMDGTPTERRGGAPAGIRRLVATEPSKAITSGARTEFVHPSEDRFLTLRECARIQTFDDDYVFHGSLSERAQQIGDAVPPWLATTIAKSILADLAKTRTVPLSGKLLSFVPTSANGMSPALAETVSRVAAAFPYGEVKEAQEALWH
jgi:DNA (cytosine-5)-methyltransferase 1